MSNTSIKSNKHDGKVGVLFVIVAVLPENRVLARDQKRIDNASSRNKISKKPAKYKIKNYLFL
ncbi:MAG: hypothetical protein NTX80_00520 [Candidatus Saccharibacteria bacterium]|nr:hypothetical protein [Candidatus Saccharibacteria bacterium]